MLKFKWTNYLPLILFAAFIWGYSAFDIFFPAREYSEMENRYLQQAPRFSARALFNNTYTLKFEEFTNDQFAFRDGWITAKSLCETALLKIENNGIVYGKDGFMFEKRVNIDREQLDKNIDSLLAFVGKFPGENITLMLVPTSDMMLTDKVPRGLNNFDQLPVIEDMYERANAAGMRTVDAHSALSRRPGDSEYEYVYRRYIYYRTDHHWTTVGANLACREFAKNLGLSIPSIDEKLFLGGTTIGREEHDFYGTHYSKCKLFYAKPDEITWFDVPVKSVTIDGEPADGLYDLKKFDTRDKYAAFLHGNNGVTVIESDCNSNRVEGRTSKVLMFKDSFGNCFAPFLCYGFDEITVVDLRYFTEVEKLVTEGDYDEILILYSFPNFTQETSLVNLKL